jgi:hypothetical protein
VTTRVLLVVALVALSALALQARQGLDWGDLSEPVAVRWAQVIFGSAILVGLYLAARRLLKMLRKAGSARHHDTDHADPEGEPFPLLLRLLAVAVIAAGLAMVWFIVRAIAPPPPGANDKPATRPGQGHGVPTPLDEKTILLVALVAGAAILLATYGSRWLAARRQVADDDPFGSRRAEVAAVLAAVDAAEEGLRSERDPRAAVLAAYAAMAHHLARGLGSPVGHRDRAARPVGRGGARRRRSCAHVDRPLPGGPVQPAPDGRVGADPRRGLPARGP